MKYVIGALATLLVGCQAENSPNSEPLHILAASTAGMQVEHCTAVPVSGTFTNYIFDFVIATFSDGSQNLSCSVTHPTPVEESGFAAYSSAFAGLTVSCNIRTLNSGISTAEWSFHDSSATFVSTGEVIPMTCVTQ